MTFFIVTGRALKQWFFFWDIYKIPYKWAKLRAVIGFITVSFLWVWGLIFYYGGYLPYQDVNYPPLSKMNINEGIYKLEKKEASLTTREGKVILLQSIRQYREYAEKLAPKGQIKTPSLFVKVWWFPLTHSKYSWIGQMEVDKKIILSNEEHYKTFLDKQDPSEYTSILKVLFAVFLVLFLWELLSQYIAYRQEHNIRRPSE